MTGRREQTLADIQTAFAAITVVNGYRNSPTVVPFIEDMEKITRFPVLEIVYGDGQFIPVDDAATVFDETIAVNVYGYVQGATDLTGVALASASESLIGDCLKMISSIYTLKIEGVTNRFNITKKPIKVVPVFMYQKNRGIFQITFEIRIRSEAF
jgi:hypothetical protein